MGTSDGRILGVTKIVNNGPDPQRWNLVIVSEGFRDVEMGQFGVDAQQFVNTLFSTRPFDSFRSAINVHRVDVASTDSGADDPTACGGTGASPSTFFDARYCNSGIRRLLVVNDATVFNVVNRLVPPHNMIIVIVNATEHGGSGGSIAVFSKAPGALEIALHEMGHTAFGLADEYEYFAGCGSGETGHDSFAGAEPAEPNVTANPNRATIKWRSLIVTATPMPTTRNANCSRCDSQSNPQPSGTVGAFEGARYFHCGIFRPEFKCKMRGLGAAFCAVCQDRIRKTLAPFIPPPSE